MTSVRPPAVAGLFYPDDPALLARAVERYLAEAEAADGGVPESPDDAPCAIIAPHAGYIYSGPTAARVYARLRPLKGRLRRILIIGPTHRVAIRGLAAPTVEAFATPLGPVPVDRAAIERLKSLPQVALMDEPHRQEHGIEVHLPFLVSVLGPVPIVPLVVGEASSADVADVIEALWSGPEPTAETLIVISSDLSHYHDYGTAQRMDRATSDAILALDARAIGYDQACGRIPIAGMLEVARARGLRTRLVDLRNSGDTAGDRQRVVGYGAYVVNGTARAGAVPDRRASESVFGAEGIAEDGKLLARHGATLLKLARESILWHVRTGARLVVDAGLYPPELSAPRATFVTLSLKGNLRGCVGSAMAWRPLVTDVAENAVAAASKDDRFAPVAAAEVAEIRLSISLLSAPARVPAASEAELLSRLEPGQDGVILRAGSRSALFLPQVWRQLPEARDFLAQLKAKAGLAPDAEAGEIQWYRFRATSIAEPGAMH